jgi:hypothetical protein
MDVDQHKPFHQRHKGVQLVEDQMVNGPAMAHLQMDGIAVLVVPEAHHEVTIAVFHKGHTIHEELHRRHHEATDDNLGDQQMATPVPIPHHLEATTYLISHNRQKEYDMPSHPVQT